ncbi:hypothetical protein IU501_32920 [Nocardia otitidiscaviarum]|uniref:hypothetical protein n=1 Tax=Nocardia otitidiscaviarum TaxID=1823 RepID=UPI0006947053|nr:hypothetical protein [Nocardia otitidiscaviarum]MBF6137775.1 hypothetical protein [Nocardia otitidiscaviarum]MBF6485296.1 hypothetical protein [Nocardia otitidiscaviarum]
MNTFDILEQLARYEVGTSRRLHLIASENPLDSDTRVPYMLAGTLARYAFGEPGQPNWAWPGRETLIDLEADTAAALGALLGADHVNLRPTSGLSAMTVALSALAEHAGDRATVLSLAESDGGHGSTGFMARRFGLDWQRMPADPRTGVVDLDALARQARSARGPLVLYLDAFMARFPFDLTGIRGAVGDSALIHYDGSHPLGLIAGGRFQNPLAEGADSLGGSVHKTWPGPVGKGIIATNDSALASRFDTHAAGWISHHHPADLAALALSTAWMEQHAGDYATAVIANAVQLADELADGGLSICADDRGATASHQVWVDIAPICPAPVAAQRLYDAGIVVNAIAIPGLAEPGLRLGVQELTRWGLDRDGMTVLTWVLTQLLVHNAATAVVAPQMEALRTGLTLPEDRHGLEGFLRACDPQEVSVA